MVGVDGSRALRLLAEAAARARQSGQPCYVAPTTDADTGEATLVIATNEPDQDHVRVDPGGVATVVYLPGG